MYLSINMFLLRSTRGARRSGERREAQTLKGNGVGINGARRTRMYLKMVRSTELSCAG